jgi:hypothetical protein
LEGDGVTNPCESCSALSCISFPPWNPQDNRWWYCDDCSQVTAEWVELEWFGSHSFVTISFDFCNDRSFINLWSWLLFLKFDYFQGPNQPCHWHLPCSWHDMSRRNDRINRSIGPWVEGQSMVGEESTQFL